MTSKSRRELLYSTTAVCLVLLIAEIVVRVVRPQITYFFVPTSTNCLARSETLAVRMVPNCSVTSEGESFRTNAHGLRGPEVEDDGAVRILAIGDSCTFGWHVAEQESFPHLLQERLDRRFGAGRYQLINAGVPGYTSYQGLAYLRNEGLRLDPAIVIFGYGFNDAIRMGDVEDQIARAAKLMPILRADDALLRISYLWRWLRSLATPPAAEDPPPRVSPQRYEDNLAEIVRIVRDHGAKPLMLSFWPADSDHPHAVVVPQVADALDAPTVVYHGPRFDVVHPTAEGYEWLAGEILEVLERLGYVTDGGGGAHHPRT